MISDIAEQGTGMLAMFVNLDQELHSDFRVWLKQDMFTARMNIGFEACASYDLLPATSVGKGLSQTFLTVYQTPSLGVLYSQPYQRLREVRDKKDMEFHERFLDAERYTLSWVGPELSSEKREFSPLIYVDRIDVIGKEKQEFNRWYVSEYLPACEKITSMMRLRRYTVIEGTQNTILLHEFDDISAINNDLWTTLRNGAFCDQIKSCLGVSAAFRRVISTP